METEYNYVFLEMEKIRQMDETTLLQQDPILIKLLEILHEPPGDNFTLNLYLKELYKSEIKYLGYLYSGEDIIGRCTCIELEKNEIDITELEILEKFLRKGFCQILMEETLIQLFERGAIKVNITNTSDFHEAACKCYIRSASKGGFTVKNEERIIGEEVCGNKELKTYNYYKTQVGGYRKKRTKKEQKKRTKKRTKRTKKNKKKNKGRK